MGWRGTKTTTVLADEEAIDAGDTSTAADTNRMLDDDSVCILLPIYSLKQKKYTLMVSIWLISLGIEENKGSVGAYPFVPSDVNARL